MATLAHTQWGIGNHDCSINSSRWHRLAEMVRAFEPDVIVLVARKMPRLAEANGLDFGGCGILLSDLAIPFAHRLLRNARVAIVDDVVNVGSTLQHARTCVNVAGARETGIFSLAIRQSGVSAIEDVQRVERDALSDDAYEEFVLDVPQVLQALPKPYDLEFPVLPCRMTAPYRTTSQVFSWLQETFGHDTVHNLSTRSVYGCSGRLTLDLDMDGGAGNHKVRLYIDDSTGICNLVPFAIAQRLSKAAPRDPWSDMLLRYLETQLAEAPSGISLWPDEALHRARLFVASLDFGLSVIDRLGDILALTSDPPVSRFDTEVLFGPCFDAAVRDSFAVQAPDQDQAIADPVQAIDDVSPDSHPRRSVVDGEFLARIKHIYRRVATSI